LRTSQDVHNARFAWVFYTIVGFAARFHREFVKANPRAVKKDLHTERSNASAQKGAAHKAVQ
jgi:hypothetical protein